MKFTKFAFAAALCALFVVQAEARTLYVNAKRPNNKGNGYKASTAKKTIQAAINIAKKGDTILVYPGTYSPIKTNNRKITIKGIKGANKTKIISKESYYDGLALAQLGKTYSCLTSDWKGARVKNTSAPLSKGKTTKFYGFLLDGLNKEGYSHGLIGISGGTATSCIIQRICGSRAWSTYGYTVAPANSCAAYESKLVGCTIRKSAILDGDGTDAPLLNSCEISRCKVLDNQLYGYLGTCGCAIAFHSKISNSLIAGNSSLGPVGAFYWCTVVNCTITENTFRLGTYNFIGDILSSVVNCIYRDNVLSKEDNVNEDNVYNDDSDAFVHPYFDKQQEHSITGEWSVAKMEEGDPTYTSTDTTNKDPKFVNAANRNYKLRKGSYAIDKGKLTKAQKKLVGTKDLAGRKRIRGKAIDRGCYEY